MTQKKKVVVTGGAGFIGSNLVAELLARDFEVHVIDTLINGTREHVPSPAQLHEVDILDTKASAAIMKEASAVFHLAALPRVSYSVEYPIESNRVNVEGTISMLVAARDAKVGRVIYSASGSAYGNQETTPFHEGLPASPVNPYGLQKYIGELYLKMFAEVYGLSTVSLRYFNIYGPNMDPKGPYGLAVAKLLEQKSQGMPLTIVGDGTQTRDFTHVRDAVRANLLAMESSCIGRGEVINIGTGRNIPVNYLADLIDGGVGLRETLPSRVEAHDSLADNARAKELLGWEPQIAIEEGIAELKKKFGI
ncbi:MAG: NAD-dependent epimerase/dehydratase family protein [Candidatus Kaiserbacteria bacterium]|nr:NAD-dependent epimerase/dehydratase family protein [Candidatus Kaiserbacteria bacterium]